MKGIKSHYQTFDFLGQTGPNTSKVKFEKAKLDKQNYENKKILDVGCNSGYFLFRVYTINSNSEGLGIDKTSVDEALLIKDSYFPNSNISFEKIDIFDFDFKNKFDIIFAFSVFHYFVNKQKIFIDKSYEMLNDNGILFLEIEEHPDKKKCSVEKAIRPADSVKRRRIKLDYPTQLQVKDWIKDKFIVLEKNYTYKQLGSLYDRYCYKLKKT